MYVILSQLISVCMMSVLYSNSSPAVAVDIFYVTMYFSHFRGSNISDSNNVQTN